MPKQYYAAIMRAKAKWRVQAREGAAYNNDHIADATPTDDRVNEAFDEHADAADAAAGAHNVENLSEADLPDDLLRQLPDGGPHYCWGGDFDERGTTWLGDVASRFYTQWNDEAFQDERAIELFEPDKYRPENARGDSQQLIIASTLLYLRKWLAYLHSEAFEESPNLPAPPCLRVYVQGNPGTGKTFIIRTIRNMVRVLTQSMRCDKAVAPTGCAASLIDAETANRGLDIPCGRKKLNGPIDSTPSGTAQAVIAKCDTFAKLMVFLIDETSMLNRAQLGWSEDRCRTLRSESHILSSEVKGRAWGGIPVMLKFGDCQQIPPVAGASHFETKPSTGDPTHADAIGKTVFEQYLDPPERTQELGLTVVMDQTVRQREGLFKDSIQEMREGTVTEATCDAYMARRLTQLPELERQSFEREALYLVPTWKATVPITFKYLLALDSPVARIDAKYQYSGRVNHAAAEVNLPVQNALCVGAVVMVLSNFLVERKLFNGSMGDVIKIVYETDAGPREAGSLPAYIVVDIPKWELPDGEQPWDPDNPTHVPIPVVTLRCDKKCCSMTTIPLRVCKAMTIHKSQGMTVAERELWKKLVVLLPSLNSPSGKTPGIAQVAVSRAAELAILAFLSTVEEPLTRELLQKIGTTAAYNGRRAFEARLRQSAATTQLSVRDEIIACDDSDQQTFEGGFNALVRWFRLEEERQSLVS